MDDRLIKRLSGSDQDPGREERLARFRDAAAAEGLIDVAYTTTDSPYGPILVAATERGVVRLGLPNKNFDVLLDAIAAGVSPRVIEQRARLDPVLAELDEYFEGQRHEFSADVDWQLVRGDFGRRVLSETARIPYGQTLSYGQVAELAGNPRAFRAAGSALGANPIPVIVPCHRILRAGGEVGDYDGGSEMKRSLLEMEGAI